MRVFLSFTGATVPGDPQVPNEDWVAATPDLVVMLDGATVRTDTGCTHGAAWYARKLGAAVIAGAANPVMSLPDVLMDAIWNVAALHPLCDLTHPGTPSAGVAIVRVEDDTLRWLVLGDVTIALDTTAGIEVISDQRVSATAAEQRREADRYPIGHPKKAAALLEMKHAELAARNTDGGYWIAAADPAAVDHALTGEVLVADVRRLAVLSDGAARAIDLFDLYPSWLSGLDALEALGPQKFIELVRKAEIGDPLAHRYSRNKVSDDATAVFASPVPSAVPREVTPERAPLRPLAERLEMATDLFHRMNNAHGDGGRQLVEAERAAEAARG